MEMTQNVAAWLNWLSHVRFFLITLLLALVLVLGKTSQLEVSTRLFLPLMILWYTLAIIYVILMRWMPLAIWHGPVQFICDLLLVTGLIYLTGTQAIFFISLYPLAIIVASILFSREATFIVAGLSFILLGGLAELIYYNVLPRPQVAVPSGRQLHTWILSTLFYFMALLTSPACWRRACAARAPNSKSSAANCRTFRRSIRTSSTRCAVACSPPIWMDAFYCSTGQARKLPDTRSPRFAGSLCRIFGRSFGCRET